MKALGREESRGGKAAHVEPLTKALELRQERDPDITAPSLVIEDEFHKVFSQVGLQPRHSWASLLKADRATS